MNIEDFTTVCVIGFGKTGVALCGLLLSLGKKVKVSEEREIENFSSSLIDYLVEEGVQFEFGEHTKRFIKDCDLIILSPGVDINNTSLSKIILETDIPYVGEIEFCSWLNKGKIVAVTGTNGKTTVSFLLCRILREKFSSVYLGGNIGIPFSSFVLNTKKRDIVVLEVSSFQLETILEFSPFVSCITNIEPDHLDRYKDFSSYIQAKKNIFRNQKPSDFAVINRNIFCRKMLEDDIKATIKYFGEDKINENFSCVKVVSSIFGIPSYICDKVFSQFEGLPHRLQTVATIRGVTFINDSKATNPLSTIWALKNIHKPIILIAGGKDKGLDYSCLIPFLKKVKKINVFGQAKEKISKVLGDRREVIAFDDLKKAIEDAFFSAKEGDVVLFSPMCSSFDMFSNYIERGNFFTRVVDVLKRNFA